MLPGFCQSGRGVLECVLAPALVDPVKGLQETVAVSAGRDEEVALVDMLRDQVGEYHPHLLIDITRPEQLLEAAHRVFDQLGCVCCGAGQGHGSAVGILGLVGAEVVGGEIQGEASDLEVLPTELLGCTGDIGGCGLVHLLELSYWGAERLGAGDGLFGRRGLLQGETGDALQLVHGSDPGDAQGLPDPSFAGLAQVVGGADALSCQFLSGAATDAPHVPHLDLLEKPFNIAVRQDGRHPTIFRILFCHAVGDLGQCLGRAKADADWDAGLLSDGVPDVLTGNAQSFLAGQRQPDKGLVDGINLNLGLQMAQYLHDPLGHVAIQSIIGGKDSDSVPLDQGLALEIWLPHLDAQGLGLVGAGDDAAVVVGEHHHRLPLKLWVEHPFAGAIEIVAVDQGKDGWHETGLQGVDHEGDYTPDLAGVSFGHMDVGIVGALGLQADVLTIFDQPFHGQLIVDYRDHHLAAGRIKGSVHHQDVIVVDAGTDHGVACHPDKKCGGWIGYHKLVEVEPAFDVVVCRAWESG